MELGAILDADLDAQRDFAPQCIIQKQNSSMSEVLHFWLIACSVFVASNAVFLQLICVFCIFLEQPNRRGTRFHAEKWSNFVLSSDIDLIGDRIDVRS